MPVGVADGLGTPPLGIGIGVALGMGCALTPRPPAPATIAPAKSVATTKAMKNLATGNLLEMAVLRL